MTETVDVPFRCEVETKVENDVNVTTVRCHGRLTNQTGDELRNTIKPLIPNGGDILIDLTDVNFMDSMGLGTLVSLKVSAINEGYCRLMLVNLTPRIEQLLRLTNLINLLSPSA
jgi:anti-sigma B factor antagonist